MEPMSLPLSSSVCGSGSIFSGEHEGQPASFADRVLSEYSVLQGFRHVRGGVRVIINVRFSVVVSATVFSATVIFAKVRAKANITVVSVTLSLTASITVGPRWTNGAISVPTIVTVSVAVSVSFFLPVSVTVSVTYGFMISVTGSVTSV